MTIDNFLIQIGSCLDTANYNFYLCTKDSNPELFKAYQQLSESGELAQLKITSEACENSYGMEIEDDFYYYGMYFGLAKAFVTDKGNKIKGVENAEDTFYIYRDIQELKSDEELEFIKQFEPVILESMNKDRVYLALMSESDLKTPVMKADGLNQSFGLRKRDALNLPLTPEEFAILLRETRRDNPDVELNYSGADFMGVYWQDTVEDYHMVSSVFNSQNSIKQGLFTDWELPFDSDMVEDYPSDEIWPKFR